MAVTTTEWHFPTTVFAAGSYTNSTNVFSENGQYATANTNGWLINGTPLRVSGFGFSIPDGMIVKTIEVGLKSYYTAVPAVDTVYAAGSTRLLKNISGNPGGSNWPNITDYVSTSDTISIISIPADSTVIDGQKLSEWTAAEWNSANMGMVIDTLSTTENAFAGSNITFYVDAVKVRLSYDDGQTPATQSNMFLCF